MKQNIIRREGNIQEPTFQALHSMKLQNSVVTQRCSCPFLYELMQN